MTTYDHKAIAAAKECFDCYEDGRGRFEYSADEYGLERFYAIAFETGRVAEREECAKNVGEFARKWWSIHCATNRHLETTRAAHDDFCALQIAIRARSAK